MSVSKSLGGMSSLQPIHRVTQGNLNTRRCMNTLNKLLFTKMFLSRSTRIEYIPLTQMKVLSLTLIDLMRLTNFQFFCSSKIVSRETYAMKCSQQYDAMQSIFKNLRRTVAPWKHSVDILNPNLTKYFRKTGSKETFPIHIMVSSTSGTKITHLCAGIPAAGDAFHGVYQQTN